MTAVKVLIIIRSVQAVPLAILTGVKIIVLLAGVHRLLYGLYDYPCWRNKSNGRFGYVNGPHK